MENCFIVLFCIKIEFLIYQISEVENWDLTPSTGFSVFVCVCMYVCVCMCVCVCVCVCVYVCVGDLCLLTQGHLPPNNLESIHQNSKIMSDHKDNKKLMTIVFNMQLLRQSQWYFATAKHWWQYVLPWRNT